MMEELNTRRVWTNDDDLPLVHGCDTRNNGESTEGKYLGEEEDDVFNDDESSEFIQPEYSNEADRIALRLFWRRFLEFYMNFLLLIISIICAGFHGQWAGSVKRDFITVFPFSIFCGFSGMFVYIILIYRWWHRIPKCTRKAVFLACGAFFFAAGMLELYFLNTHSFGTDGIMYELEYTNENKPIQTYYRHASKGTITSVACLSFSVTALCFINTFVLIT